MKIIAMIPARYAATRFPAKLMQPLGGKTVIRHTYDNTRATGLFDEVMVVTDSPVIYEEITRYGGKARMSVRTHESGSDRIDGVVTAVGLRHGFADDAVQRLYVGPRGDFGHDAAKGSVFAHLREDHVG